LDAAGRWGRQLVSAVDNQITDLGMRRESVDLAFNFFGISMDNSIDNNPLVSPISKNRRRSTSPDSSTKGFRGHTQQSSTSPIPINYGIDIEEWQKEDGFKEIQRIRARRGLTTSTEQQPESIRSDISSETNRSLIRESPMDLKRLIFTNSAFPTADRIVSAETIYESRMKDGAGLTQEIAILRQRDQYMVRIAREGSIIMVEETQAYFLQVEDMISKTKEIRDAKGYEDSDDKPLIFRLLGIIKESQMPNYPTIGSIAILKKVGEDLNRYKIDGILTEQDMAVTLAKAQYFRGSRGPEEAVKDLAVVVAFDLIMKKDKPKWIQQSSQYLPGLITEIDVLILAKNDPFFKVTDRLKEFRAGMAT
jgi:hypothetical protein